jgi:hypothetical protein
VGGGLLESGKVTTEAMLTLIPIICIVLFSLAIFGVILIVVLKVVFERANRKVDTIVRRVEGKVNFVWVERQERDTTKTGPMYKTVRVLEMRIGGETFNVNNELLVITHNSNRGAKAACSAHGSPSVWRDKSVSTDFHELRQDLSPPNRVAPTRCG